MVQGYRSIYLSINLVKLLTLPKSEKHQNKIAILEKRRQQRFQTYLTIIIC